MNQKVGMRLLAREGCVVKLAGDGEEALEQVCVAADPGFDIIFMDCHMPRCDGISATARIRQYEHELNRRSLIIGVTATGSESDQQSCLLAGMDQFLPKPFDLDRLRSILSDAVRRKALASDG